MSSPSEVFECRWQPSRGLLAAYLLAQLSALLALWSAAIGLPLSLLGSVACLLHGAWVLPRCILLSHPHAVVGLRQDASGWQLCRRDSGWQPVQLCRDSLALPLLVVLRYRLAGQRWVRGLCIPADALEPAQHRRLRVRLRFSRNRWAAAE